MPNNLPHVVPKVRLISEAEFSDKLVAGLARVAGDIGRGNLADKAGRTPRALMNVFNGSIPEGKGLLDFLNAHASALDEVLALYGFGLHRLPDVTAPGEDIDELKALHELTGARLAELNAEKRDHRNVISIGEKARPVAMACHRMIAAGDAAKVGRRA